MEADDAGGVEVEDGVIWSPRLDLFEALELGGGELAAVDDCPNATHLESFKFAIENGINDI